MSGQFEGEDHSKVEKINFGDLDYGKWEMFEWFAHCWSSISTLLTIII